MDADYKPPWTGSRRVPNACPPYLNPFVGTERYVAKENATHAERAAEQLMHVINQTEETGLFLDYAGRPIPW